MTHRFPVRVYYEDTDFGGIVYYANYLKFIERARSEWVRDLGVDQIQMKADDGVVFAVRRVEADYLATATLDDDLIIETTTELMTGARWVLRQDVLRDEQLIFSAEVTIVAIGANGAPARLPAILRRPLH